MPDEDVTTLREEDHCFLCGAEYTALTAWKNGKLICFPCRNIEEDAEEEDAHSGGVTAFGGDNEL